MNEQNVRCSDERLLDLLRSDQDSDKARDAAAHLDHCPQCQERLEALAAQPQDWRLAHECLSLDNPAESNERDDHPRIMWATMRCQREPSGCSESMARQLLAPPSHPEMLGRIGRYEVERVIGAGGMGVVFKAFDTELNRPVAVKVLAPYLAGSGAARKRFAREARAAAAIVHEHVVAIHNVETEGDSPFLVMHYVAGESLQQRLDREGSLELTEILRIGLQTAAGLAAAHAQGLVHRDVKPSNILLEQGIERTLLTDFGLARASDDASVTFTGYHPGTPQYMSPEQARGEAIDARSDLFSLGSVLYAMCTGRAPFRAETTYGILRKITDCEPRPIRELNPAIPDWLERCVTRLLSKSASERFQSAAQVADLLRDCLAHVQHPTAVDLPRECQSPRRWTRQNRLSRTTLAAISVTAVCLAVLLSLVIRKFPWFPGGGGSVNLQPTVADTQPAAASEGEQAGESTTKQLSKGEPNETSLPSAPKDEVGAAANGQGAKADHAKDTKVETASLRPKAPGLLPLLELHLAYLEQGADRTEYTVPGGEQKIFVAKQPFGRVLDGVAARVLDDSTGKAAITVSLGPDSSKRIEGLTRQHLDKPVALLVNGKLLIAPTIRERSGKTALITGQLSRADADRIAQEFNQKTEAVNAIALVAQNASDIDAGPVWGEAVNGLQLGVSGIRQDRHFKSGDTIRFRLNVRNVGTEPIRFGYDLPEFFWWIGPLVEKANGERVIIHQVRVRFVVRQKPFTETLEPNGVVSIQAIGILVLGASDAAHKDWPRIEKPAPGEYRLRAGCHVYPLDANGTRIANSLNLTSGTVPFHID